MRRGPGISLAVAAAAALAALAGAVPASAAPPDVSSADAAIVVDARNGETMFAKRPRERHAIASTTKLMTALLALERARPSDVFDRARLQRPPGGVQDRPRDG